MSTHKVSSATLVEIIIASAATALAIAVSVIAFHYLEGWMFLITAVILTCVSVIANVAIFNRRTNKDDLIAGIRQFSQDHSYRFTDKDNTCEEINKLFEQIQLNDEKNRILIRNISHEVRTPLTGLKVIAEGIADGVFEPDAKHMKAILDDVRRIDETLSVMKQYSDIMDENVEGETKGDVARALVAAYNRAKRVGNDDIEITLKKKLDGGFKTYAKIDDQSLETIFDIVIGNCFEHASNMTKIEITLDGIKIKDVDYIKVSIADNGCGMSIEELSHIKDVFSKKDDVRTLSTRTKTTLGLGLNIADTMTRRSGGSMNISSKENIGTCVSFIFPIINN